METNYQDCEICLDEVEGLGSFIEIEKLSKDGDAAVIQKELYALLARLGCEEKDYVLKGYDILMFERGNA